MSTFCSIDPCFRSVRQTINSYPLILSLDWTASDGTLFEPYLNRLNHPKIQMGQLNPF